MKYLENKSELNVNAIFAIIKLNFKKLLSIVIVANIIIIAYSYLIPEKYVSEATILPPKKESAGGLSSFLQSMAGNLQLGGMGKGDENQLFVEILGSRTVAEFVINDLKLKEKEQFKEMPHYKLVEMVQKSMDNELPKSGVIKIYSNASTEYFPFIGNKKYSTAKLSQMILNSAIKGLDMVLRERSTSSARKTKEYIQKEIVYYRLKLDTLESKVEKFQQDNNVLEIEEQTKAIVSQAVDVGKNMAVADIELNIAKLQFQDNSPQLDAYKKQYEVLKNQYQKIQTGGLTSEDSYAFPLNKVPELLKSYLGMIRDRKILEQVLIYLETQKHQEAIQEKRDVPVVELLDSPSFPEERDSPKRKVILILGLILSSILSLVYLLLSAVYKGNIFLKNAENK